MARATDCKSVGSAWWFESALLQLKRPIVYRPFFIFILHELIRFFLLWIRNYLCMSFERIVSFQL